MALTFLALCIVSGIPPSMRIKSSDQVPNTYPSYQDTYQARIGAHLVNTDSKLAGKDSKKFTQKSRIQFCSSFLGNGQVC